jgi:hypothetical protein
VEAELLDLSRTKGRKRGVNQAAECWVNPFGNCISYGELKAENGIEIVAGTQPAFCGLSYKWRAKKICHLQCDHPERDRTGFENVLAYSG